MGRCSLLPAVVLLAACATSSVVDTAYHGDLSALRTEIARARSAGDLSASTVRDLAEAVVRRELGEARGEAAAERVDALRPCASSLVAALGDRAELSDEGGAQATRLLLALGKVDAEALVSKYARAESGAWRALAARGATGPRHASLRRAFMVDPDVRVRRSALEAALDVPVPGDFDELLAEARLDPDPLARSYATRAIGAMGTERAVLSLEDLWPKADEGDRLVIVEAWAQSAARAAGGTHRLVRVVELQTGLPRIAAAAALARGAGAGAGDGTALGRAVIVRAVSTGASDVRRLAVLSVPLDDDGVAALVEAGADADEQVRVLALARLLEHPASRDRALQGLRKLDEAAAGAARQARAALAAVGDRQPVPRLLKDLEAQSPHARRTAALALLRLGDLSASAPALADSDTGVRLAFACAVLAGG